MRERRKRKGNLVHVLAGFKKFTFGANSDKLPDIADAKAVVSVVLFHVERSAASVLKFMSKSART